MRSTGRSSLWSPRRTSRRFIGSPLTVLQSLADAEPAG